jgi:hypothetical protein
MPLTIDAGITAHALDIKTIPMWLPGLTLEQLSSCTRLNYSASVEQLIPMLLSKSKDSAQFPVKHSE